jgi:hypothetical protein
LSPLLLKKMPPTPVTLAIAVLLFLSSLVNEIVGEAPLTVNRASTEERDRQAVQYGRPKVRPNRGSEGGHEQRQ